MTTEFNIKDRTITVDGVTYGVEQHSTDLGYRYTIQLDGEDVFEGLKGKVENEEYIESYMNPRDASNVGVMSVHYRGYDLGGGEHDEDISDIDFEIECKECEGSGESVNWVVGIHRTADPLVVGSQEECEEWLEEQDDKLDSRYYIEPISCKHCDGDGMVNLNPVDYFKQVRGARVVIGLTVYEHSGITMRAGDVTLPFDADRWDTSFVGFMFDTPTTLKETMGDDVTDEQIHKALVSEVEVYASYLEGDVTHWQVEDEETGYFESCGGYVGDHQYANGECWDHLAHAVAKRIAEEAERAYWMEREVVTV